MYKKILLFGVLGLVTTLSAAELGLDGLRPSELKEIEKEIAAGNVPPNFSIEKSKRLVPKLTNTDSQNFNHLNNGVNKATYNVLPQFAYTQPQQQNLNSLQSPLTTQSFNPAQLSFTTPLRLLQGSQYFPNNQYLPYLQNPQLASQLAAQYSYQPSAHPHFLQTPTQLQYVSPPNFGSVPSSQFKALTSKTPVVSSVQSQPSLGSQPTSQVVLPSNMYTGYPQQQSYVMLLVQPQQQNLLYPAQQMLLYGAQNPLLQALYNNQHRFSFPYNNIGANQLSYLTNQAAQQLAQSSVGAEDTQTQSVNLQEQSQNNQYNTHNKA